MHDTHMLRTARPAFAPLWATLALGLFGLGCSTDNDGSASAPGASDALLPEASMSGGMPSTPSTSTNTGASGSSTTSGTTTGSATPTNLPTSGAPSTGGPPNSAPPGSVPPGVPSGGAPSASQSGAPDPTGTPTQTSSVPGDLPPTPMTSSPAASTQPSVEPSSAGSGTSTPDDSGANPSGGAPEAGDDPSPPTQYPDTPCEVPGYIFDQPAPVGWASQSGGTLGGGTATPQLVTQLSEFEAAIGGDEPRVIYVQGDFSPSDIEFGSNKTVIGCSDGATLRGHIGIGSGSSNIIIRNLTIVGYGEGNCAFDPNYDPGTGCSSGSDAVGVNGNAHHVWFDHCAVRDGTDGNLDVTNDADFVTVSWTKFSYTPRTDDSGDDSTGAAGHRYSNLVGGTDSAPNNWPATRPLNVTWHHNWWAEGVVERQPRVRFGRNHIFNNYYNSSVTNYCVRAGIEASVLIEGNAFDGVDSPHQFNNDDDEDTAFIALGEGERSNSYANTEEGEDEGGGEPFTPPYEYEFDAAADVPSAITASAGPH